MIIPGILFLFGLLCLIKGGDWFVDGASALARRFHLPELLIGRAIRRRSRPRRESGAGGHFAFPPQEVGQAGDRSETKS